MRAATCICGLAHTLSRNRGTANVGAAGRCRIIATHAGHRRDASHDRLAAARPDRHPSGDSAADCIRLRRLHLLFSASRQAAGLRGRLCVGGPHQHRVGGDGLSDWGIRYEVSSNASNHWSGDRTATGPSPLLIRLHLRMPTKRSASSLRAVAPPYAIGLIGPPLPLRPPKSKGSGGFVVPLPHELAVVDARSWARRSACPAAPISA